MKKLKKIIFCILVLSVILLPALSLAQFTPPAQTNPPNMIKVEAECGAGVDDIGHVLCRIGYFLNKIIPLLLLLGVLYFVWGVITYVIKNDEESKKKGKDKIIYGIIGLVVIVGLWGLINIVVNTFDLKNQALVVNPTNVVNNNLQIQNSNSCFTTYQTNPKPKISDLLNYVTCLIGSSVVPLIFILAVASFVWGVVQYVTNADSEEKRSKGRSFMMWGIIALAVMVSIWGLVGILRNTFNLNQNNFVPQVDTTPD
jgi:cytochrome bd-type quinol oxidase subunit 2